MALGLAALNKEQAREATLRAHTLPSSTGDAELVAEALRRAASIRCPSTPNALVTTVTRALRPILSVDESIVADVLDTVIGTGDLVEWLDERSGYRRRTLYLGSPTYVRRRSGDVLLIGVRPDAQPLVGEALQTRVAVSGHIRRLVRAADSEEILLEEYGLREVTEAQWMKHSEPCEAADLVNTYNRSLERQPPSGEIADLRILDPAQPTAYYRGRWRQVDPAVTGRFVARRSQGYGADLWCYVAVQDGAHLRLLDLPIDSRQRGCDEAWRLQAAIDATLGRPQEVIIESTGAGTIRVGLPSPPPRWLQRRWDLIGCPTTARRALFAYEFSASDTRDEVDFVKRQLWMTQRISTETS